MPAGEVVSQFVREEDRQERDRERQSGEEKRWVVISERKGLEESVQRDRLVVGIGGSKMRSSQEASKQC